MASLAFPTSPRAISRSAVGLKNFKAEQQRAEKVKRTFDFVVSRAVTRLPEFMNWIKGKIAEKNKNKLANGVLYLKGGDLQEELNGVRYFTKEFLLTDYFSEAIFETKKVVWVKVN